jgi:hypothetical protein
VQSIDTSLYTVDNKWECDIDGTHYEGTVDTSYMQLTGIFPDTMVVCTGTSSDKKANIHFVVKVNRNTQPEGTYTNFSGMLGFDAGPNNSAIANWGMRERIHFVVDTLVSNKLKATFNGTASGSYNPGTGFTHTISNGRFSCTFGKGNNEPKFFSFNSQEGNVAGVVRNARLESNSLILQGVIFGDYEQRFKLTVRTGGTIKPGTYEGKNGDVGMSLYVPSIYRYYIADTPSSSTVVIHSISGNVVRGTFSAIDRYGRPLQQGKFSCRVKDYIPEVDFADFWQFTTDEGPEGIFGFRAFGGNIVNAALSQDGSKLFQNPISALQQFLLRVLKHPFFLAVVPPFRSGFFHNRIDAAHANQVPCAFELAAQRRLQRRRLMAKPLSRYSMWCHMPAGINKVSPCSSTTSKPRASFSAGNRL